MSAGEKVLDLLFPPKCPFCQRVLEDPKAPVCPLCGPGLPWLEGRAGERRVEGADGCFSPLAYRDKVPQAVHRYKYSRVRALGRPLARLMAQCMADRLPGGADLICWAPVSRRRLRERGFDQAKLMARELGRLCGLPVLPLLEKIRDTPPQSELAAESARRANARGVYALRPGTELAGRRVVLVDDVVTSGATLSECAGVLRAGGAAEVWCLTLAQARHDPRPEGKKDEK